MPGRIDEPKWDEAKAAARKQYPDLGDKNPRFWKIVSSIYKKMGGKFTKKMEKSMEAVDAAIRRTPAFINDPRLWIAAIRKSCGSRPMQIEDADNVIKSYNEMGGGLLQSSMLETTVEDGIAKSISAQFVGEAESPEAIAELEKGKMGSFSATHRYAQRVQKPGGGYRYIYEKTGAKVGHGQGAEGTGHGYQKVPKRPGQMGVVPEGQATSKTSMAIIVDKLAKKDASAQRAALQNVSDDALVTMATNAASKGHKGLTQVIHQEKEARKVKQATRKAEVKKSQDEFDVFCETYREDIKKSLAESHPGWDSDTLESRLEPQLRQMFRLHQG